MKYLLLLFVSLYGFSSGAQEAPPAFETVVEDVIFNTSSRVILDEKTIRDSRAPNITSLISTQANITVANTPLQPNSIYIRGGDSSHVLILVDGVPFYDASTSQRTFNLNSMDIRSVRRIEIIKGSQTVLYGGQALSGVIKIDTIPQDFVSKSVFQGEAGSQRAREISFLHTEPFSDNQLAIVRGHGGWKDAKSPVLDSSKTYERNNWSGEGTYAWKGNIEGHLKAHYIQDRNFSPTSSFITYKIIDTDDFEQYNRQLGASTSVKFNSVPWTPKLSAGMQNSYRELDQPVGPTNPALADEDYGANLRTVRLDFVPLKINEFQIVSGLSYNYEDFFHRSQGVEKRNFFSEQRGLFAKIDGKLNPKVAFTLGGRAENWDDRNTVGTYQVGLTFFEKTKLEYSTGYKIPSLFQLYSDYGNPNLKEERANQYSLTQELDITASQKASATFFVTNFSNLIVIQGGAPPTYGNVNKAESRGVELTYSLRPTESSSILMTYGYQEPKDLTSNRWLARRPLVNGSIRYTQHWNDIHTGTFEIQGAGERVDRSGATVYSSIPGYAIANASYSFNAGYGATLYTRLNNLLDYRYQETYTYYSEGFSGVIGVEYVF